MVCLYFRAACEDSEAKEKGALFQGRNKIIMVDFVPRSS